MPCGVPCGGDPTTYGLADAEWRGLTGGLRAQARLAPDQGSTAPLQAAANNLLRRVP